ncbi:MAG: metallothionein [Verrucomicrobiota bacterium]
MSTPSDTPCACPDCTCKVSEGHHVEKDGKDFCSEACASGHASGDGCCDGACDCHG